MLRKFLFAFVLLTGGRLLAADLAFSPQWLRLYQTRSNFKSAITSDTFFFSPRGSKDPRSEFEAAVLAYENPAAKFGREKLPAACAFPARKAVLEKLLQRKFPSPDCPDFDAWKKRLDADQASLVFVGAYPGNPASIFGHTFLRLSNSKRETEGREGVDLLSHSVGFMARSNPDDPRALYMLKGLAGFYPGYYEIEPHYMKVGLYNNAESRDLWEVRLRLAPEEMELLVAYLWEVLFNAELRYYFIDENCSQKLIKFLEAVKPSLDISRHLSLAVLPAETVRAAVDSGLAEPAPRFRSSIQRRLELKLGKFSRDQRESFNRARASVEQTKKLEDPSVIAALLDYWLFENYAASARLPGERAVIMDATYQRAAAVRLASEPSNAEIVKEENLSPPFLGHRPKWIEARAGTVGDAAEGGIRYRSGVHPFWSSDPGYRDVSAIEFFGVDLGWNEKERWKWKALLLNARSLENAFGLDRKLSWALDLNAANTCWICENDRPQAQASGGVGASWLGGNFAVYSLAHARSAAWLSEGLQGVLAPGLLAGLKWGNDSTSFVLEGSHHWWRSSRSALLDARWTYRLDANRNVFLNLAYEDRGARATRNEATLGWVQFFN